MLILSFLMFVKAKFSRSIAESWLKIANNDEISQLILLKLRLKALTLIFCISFSRFYMVQDDTTYSPSH